MTKQNSYWQRQKESMKNWFYGYTKYSKKELIINWMLIILIALIEIIVILGLIVRWKFFIGAIAGNYPAYLVFPVWMSVLISVLVVFLCIVVIMKLQQRSRRKKYNGISSLKNQNVLNEKMKKILDKKYTTIEDESGKTKRFV